MKKVYIQPKVQLINLDPEGFILAGSGEWDGHGPKPGSDGIEMISQVRGPINHQYGTTIKTCT